MRIALSLAAAIGVSLLNIPAGAMDQSAPFDLSWGPVANVPRPSLATREDNVTLLMYRGDQLPSGARDTEEIVLEICKTEGLQQIVWISRFLLNAEAHDKLEAIMAEGVRQYGQAEVLESGIIFWSAGRTKVTDVSNVQGFHRIIMVSTGPSLNTCSEEHKASTGHTVSDHWMKLLPNNISE